MAFLHFVCKLLSNLWEHHITTMLSDVFCIRLLTSKNQFVHGLLIDVIVICSRVLGRIHEVRFINELCQLPLMDIIFSTAKVLYNIGGLSGLAIFQHPYTSLARVQGFYLMVTTHNSNALKDNGMAEDIFYFLFLLEAKKIYVSDHQIQKSLCLCPQFFCFLFFIF